MRPGGTAGPGAPGSWRADGPAAGAPPPAPGTAATAATAGTAGAAVRPGFGGDALAADVLVVDQQRFDALLALLGRAGEVAPAGSPVRSARGVAGPMEPPGTVLVARALLEADHGGGRAKVFVADRGDGRLGLVVVAPDWSQGLPAGRAGARAVAAALQVALEEAFTPGPAPLRARVTDMADGRVAIALVPTPDAPEARVGPLAGNAGFVLFAHPGQPGTAAVAATLHGEVAAAAAAAPPGRPGLPVGAPEALGGGQGLPRGSLAWVVAAAGGALGGGVLAGAAGAVLGAGLAGAVAVLASRGRDR